MSAEEQSHLVGLESGDEFEDFPIESWTASEKQHSSNLWEEQWEDDDKLDDDFAGKLKAEIAKAGDV